MSGWVGNPLKYPAAILRAERWALSKVHSAKQTTGHSIYLVTMVHSGEARLRELSSGWSRGKGFMTQNTPWQTLLGDKSGPARACTAGTCATPLI